MVEFKTNVMGKLIIDSESYDLAVDYKVTDLKYMNSRGQIDTISGTITGLVIDANAHNNAPGHVDRTLKVLSSYQLSKQLTGYSREPMYEISTIRIKPESDKPVFNMLYIPVSQITEVGAIVPTDTVLTVAFDKETVDESGKTTPEVIEAEVTISNQEEVTE